MAKKPPDTTKMFAERLSRLIQERGVVVSQLTDDEDAPLSRSYAYRLKKPGVRLSSPTLNRIARILDYLETSIPEFFETWPRPNPTPIQRHLSEVQKLIALLELGGPNAEGLKAQIDAAYAVLVKPPKRTTV